MALHHAGKEVFSFTGALSFPLAVLRRIGALSEHHAAHQSVSSKLYADLEQLQDLVKTNPELRPALRVGVLPDSAAFSEAWKEYMDRHGHRGIFESDIARPRFSEKPETLLKSIAARTDEESHPPRRTLRGILTLPLWKEYKNHFMREKNFGIMQCMLFHGFANRCLNRLIDT